MRAALRRWLFEGTPEAPPELARRFRTLTDAQLEPVARALREHFFVEGFDGPDPESEAGRRDFEAHLRGKLEADRRTILPWLARTLPLDGARVLEVGSGTGTSTVAMAEQGARVTAVDVDAGAAAVARARVEAHGVDAEVRVGDAGELLGEDLGGPFDLVIFSESLEHMTWPERRRALARAWEQLPGGGLLGIVETPNRLWYLDHHTSRLPFFMWLPDDLAREYARFSPVQDLRHHAEDGDATAFARRGRGVSYHDLELALPPGTRLEVVSPRRPSHRSATWSGALRWWLSRDRAYERLLARVGPEGMAPAFFQPFLNLVLRKGAGA